MPRKDQGSPWGSGMTFKEPVCFSPALGGRGGLGGLGEVERTEVELRWDWGDPGGRWGFLKGA